MTAREVGAIFLISVVVWAVAAGLFFLVVRLTTGYWPVTP